MSFRTFIRVILAWVVVSQIYWLVRGWLFSRRHIRSKATRIALAFLVCGFGFSAFAFTFNWFGRRQTPVHLSVSEALLAAPTLWWLAASMVAFLLVLLLVWPVRIAAGTAKLVRRKALVSPGRRHFLEQAATAVTAVPFVAGAYGLLYGRLNLEVTRPRLRLARLPRAFDGFRIAQLSDIHIGPFMPEEQILRYVRIANELKPDLIVLTGDFITWDPSTQQAVVAALARLKAPFGVFGSLGNHETWSGTTGSITALFAAARIPILRHTRTAIVSGRDSLNLIGVDFDAGFLGLGQSYSEGFLKGVELLVAADTANILLSHNPNTFDRAAELGIDLSLAGHTHGGQVSLEFINPNLAPSRLVTDYVAGHFRKPGGQLYVNRGIGTFEIPIRLGARPEITVFELVRTA